MGGVESAAVEDVADVAIIGNGPSALALAAALSGLVPEVRSAPVGDPEVAELARRWAGKTVDEIKLPEDFKPPKRRCLNPMAALIDAFHYPDGDGRGQSLLRYGQLKPFLRHTVIGSGPTGGSWQSMSPSTMTLSPGSWMDLPGHTLTDHLRSSGLASEEAHDLQHYYGSAEALAAARVPRWLVAEYYSAYAQRLTSTEFLSGTVQSMEEDEDGHWKLQISMPGEEADHCKTVKAKAVALATGTADVPRRLQIPGEDLDFVTHRPPIHNQELLAKIGHLLVVGAGLSAADAILHALGLSAEGVNVRVTHVFRGKAADTKIGKMFGQTSLASMYRDEEWLAKMMQGSVSDPRYTAKAEAQLQEILEDGTCIIKTNEGQERVEEVSVVALLLGAGPSLHFLPSSLRKAQRPEPYLPRTRADGQPSSHPYFLEVIPETLQLADAKTGQVLRQNVFALGPLRGDNFIRFLTGDAFVVVFRSCIVR